MMLPHGNIPVCLKASPALNGWKGHKMETEDLEAFGQAGAVSEEPAPEVESESGTGEQQEASPATDEQDAQPDGSGEEPGPDGDESADEDLSSFAGVKTAMLKERERRQDAQQQLAEFKGRLDEISRHQQQQNPPTQEQPKDEGPTFWDDPEAYTERRLQQNAVQVSFRAGEAALMAVREDYNEAKDAFVEAARANPSLVAEAEANPNPALFVYDRGKMLKELSGVESLDSLREKIRAEEREKLIAEQRKSKAVDAASKATTSSASASSAGQNQGQRFVSAAEMSFNDMLKGINNQY